MEDDFEETVRDQELMEGEYAALEASHEEIKQLLYKFMGGLNLILILKFVMYSFSLFKVQTFSYVFKKILLALKICYV